MDKETSQAFAKVLEYLVDGIGGVIEDKGSDMTEYLKTLGSEIVAYKLGIAYLWLWFAIFLAIIGIAFLIISIIKDESIGIILGACVILIALIVGIFNTYTVIGCKTFPEKIVIEYIQSEYNSSTYR